MTQVGSFVGSVAWAEATGGILREEDRQELLDQIANLSAISRQARSTITFADIGNSLPAIPDSVLGNQIIDFATTNYPDWMIQHCLRTYLWGCLMAVSEQLSFDPEVYLAASIFHDAGLEQLGSAQSNPPIVCYSILGGRVARETLEHWEIAKCRIDLVEQSIIRHLNILVPVNEGVEAHLLNVGSAFDAIASGWKQIDTAIIREVVARHPRLDMDSAMTACCQTQAKQNPASRIAFLCERGFAESISRTPFSRL